MVVIAFLSTSVAMFLIGWLVGAWCGRQSLLDEIKKENK